MEVNKLSTGFKNSMKPNIEYTLDLIKQLHAAQTDQSGNPYANHPQRVAGNVRKVFPDCDDDVVMAALLHDAIEDCSIDEAWLRLKNYSEDCIAIVSLLTKPPNDPRSYEEVIDTLIASGNQGAMMVKIADNMDNLHPERVLEFQQINSEKAKRLSDRYRQSIEKLCAAMCINKDRIFELIENATTLNHEIVDARL